MKKAVLRKQMIAQLQALDSTEKVRWDKELTKQILASSAYQEAGTIATFLSMDVEFNTQLLIDAALADGKRVLVPKTFGKGRMIFVEYDAAQLQISSFGVREPISDKEISPDQIDLIHVPGLAWNKEGYRIGFGGGYYDRYLKDFSGRSVSTIYPFQSQEFAKENFDIPVESFCYL
ncbi:5-formyltetrahydrofolate cyclo-ligase [Streptococcus sp. X16XC17]|uniref:5-formyltetrahydrofolate cyclo-ligase n=1 Tax=unclassified Streptococcus TaxID=2608887 RepID=UPI00066FBA7B|nr:MULTISPECIES: 5-formyltetrahydrofolate cyclo-ligase [unclassified Streptococcus]TCD45833.1 5-formyltetrahydrofolate cyclo-ligase [Streptococcus sp. X16XC17]